ncbi:hypothetical protein AG1IA_08148 [Rhizoctonia solani AG-1 IA]|uniref:Uncharacterized protein n=1 Tax=Thanatephorus cucumeris (strain AG1-IA) TaxID=983506 RepID=L8WIV5_THACA|nr:hypothetical protein AG1IA_08148 [Rhizoctonia solani AG-1 IA]
MLMLNVPSHVCYAGEGACAGWEVWDGGRIVAFNRRSSRGLWRVRVCEGMGMGVGWRRGRCVRAEVSRAISNVRFRKASIVQSKPPSMHIQGQFGKWRMKDIYGVFGANCNESNDMSVKRLFFLDSTPTRRTSFVSKNSSSELYVWPELWKGLDRALTRRRRLGVHHLLPVGGFICEYVHGAWVRLDEKRAGSE